MKKLLALLMAVLMIFALAGCSSGKTDTPETTPTDSSAVTPDSSSTDTATSTPTVTLQSIKDKGKLVVGTEAQYPPYEFKDAKGNILGFDMWLAQKIADSLGVKLEIQDMGFDGIIPAIQTGTVDMGIAGFSPTDERKKAVDFSKIYYAGTQSILVMADKSGTYVDKDSIKGLTLGSQKGSLQETLVKDQFKDCKQLSLDTVPNLILELKNGNIAGVMMETAVAKNYAGQDSSLAVSPIPVEIDASKAGSVVCMQKGSSDLVDAVNKVIDQVTGDGTFDTAVQDALTTAGSLNK